MYIQIENKYPKYFIAYSGGLDSTVLLHRLWQQQFPLHAIHINHQLQPQADAWEQHCIEQCAQWNIPITVKKIQIKKLTGQSLEALARTARYQAFTEILTPDAALCTAHHQDDQAETLLLQLIRGSGIAGLSAMPTSILFAKGYLLRPLLSTTRRELEEYAAQQQLNWIEDPSNQHTEFDRNYLRHTIMPLLRARWPSVSNTLARSANHCAEASQLLTQTAAEDYAHIIDKENKTRISISRLQKLAEIRQRHCLRYWLTECALPLPNSMQLEQLLQQLNSRQDAQPCVHWSHIYLRRHKDFLCVEMDNANMDLTQLQLPWNLEQPLTLPGGLGSLTAEFTLGSGISKAKLARAPVTIRFRCGTLRCQPAARARSQTLKKLFQEYAIPAWKRNHIPLLFCGEELVAVIGYWICAPFLAAPEEAAWNVEQIRNNPFV